MRNACTRVIVGGALAVLSLQAQPSGEAVYMRHCARCHGPELQGGNAQSLVDGVWQFGADEGYIRANIEHGITHLGMPAYGKVLSPADIKAVVGYLRDHERARKPPPRPLPETLQSQEYDIRVELVADGLEVPWAIDFPDDHTLLIAERPGRLRVVRDGALLKDAVAATPEVLNEGQGGLLDVAIDPDYPANGWVYLAYSHALASPQSRDKRPPAMTRVVRGCIRDLRWVDQQVLFEADPTSYRTTRHHYGSRLAFDAQGMLYFSIGDRGHQADAQDPTRPTGKIHRIHRDGRIPRDNPFADGAKGLPSVFSWGHRNPQGLAVHLETGALWETEHGPMGGDEINVLRGGRNYGWPEVTYGRNYDGTVISALEHKPGMEQPAFFYRPSIAVCGLDIYRGKLFPKWQNHLILGALRYESVDIVTVAADRVLHSETIVKNLGRVRDVACGPDGAVYVVLNSPGRVLRLTPLQDRG